MKRFRNNIKSYFLAAVILAAYCTINYLIIPEIGNYEVFAYVFWGGLLLYAIYYLLTLIIQIVLNSQKDTLILVLCCFLLLETILYYFLDSSLILSFYRKKDVGIFLMYHIIPFFITIMKLSLRFMRKDSINVLD